MRFGLILPDGNNKKKLGRLWATFEGGFSMFSGAKTNVIKKKNIVASALETCILTSFKNEVKRIFFS